ncbi:MAG: nuclear transport factor 2 family protein [Gemmatimonadetes bacterium]|nr:nuclear transport factor 2 family protein [Gemmatimonadota bacterium]
MTARFARWSWRLAVALLVPLHARAQGADPIAEVRKASAETWAAVTKHLLSGDITGLASLWTADGLLISAGSPNISGAANIEANVKRQAAQVKFLAFSHVTQTLEASGDLALETGTQTATVQVNGQKPMTSTSRYVIVYRREKGAWRTRLDMETPAPAPARAMPQPRSHD